MRENTNIIYKYKEIQSHSKYEIMCLASNVEDVTWYYNDDFFNCFDWTKEPAESIEELYYQRAKSLREKYDYLVLMYSGGSDSSNILDTFCKHNIHLDEICSHINYEGSNEIENLLNNEILNVGGAKQKAEACIEKFKLKTKYRLFDVTQNTIGNYEKFNFDSNYWVNNAGVSFTFAKPKAGTILETGVAEWINLYNSGKKIAFIWGNHKPKILGNRGVFYFCIDDYIDQSVSVKGILNGENNAIDELFYWGANSESVKIMIKQGHIIKNFLSDPKNRLLLKRKYDAKLNDESFVYQNELFTVYTDESEKLSCRMGNNEIRKLIYPDWKMEHEKLNKKQTSNFLNDKDKWFWSKDNKNTQIYLSSLQNFTSTIQDCWKDSVMKYKGINYVEKTKRLTKLYRI